MLVVDYVAIGIVALGLLSGYVVGFGKTLRLISEGILGFFISLLICWFTFGIVLSWGFVQDLLTKFVTFLQEKDSWICNILLSIRIDMILLATILIAIIQIIRIIIVKFINAVFEADNSGSRFFNKLFGMILMLAFFVAIVLIIFQVAFMISGNSGAIFDFVNGSTFKVDYLYSNNPLNSFIELIKSVNPLQNI